MELRPYQLAAVEAIEVELARVPATLLVLATGLGKTVTFAELARRCALLGQRVLVLAHRGELLDQAAATLRRFGLTVAVEQADQRVDVHALPHAVVASVQTMRGRRLARFASDAFQLVVIDEAHHATAPGYRAVLAHFAAARVLGVTATPDRGDGVALRHVFESAAFTMDLREGIAGGWLAPIELRSVVVDQLDLTNVCQRAGDFSADQLERELTRDVVLHAIAAPLVELRAGRQTLVFTAGVHQAHALAELLCHYGVRAAAVDGSMAGGDRAALLERYRTGELEVVCNCALWTEGFDAPETSCIALARPTRSRALLTQMIGRGTRLAPGKASCLVLDFEPQRAGRIRLASPADVLAGKELSAVLMARTLARTRTAACDLSAAIEAGKAELDQEGLAIIEAERIAREQQVHRIRELGIVYEAPHLDTRTLLAAIAEPEGPDWQPQWKRKPASQTQRNILTKAGIKLPRGHYLSAKAARRLIALVEARRQSGLCTLPQARRLASFGLRDDVSFDDAHEAISAIAENKWVPPVWLFNDPRFAREADPNQAAV